MHNFASSMAGRSRVAILLRGSSLQICATYRLPMLQSSNAPSCAVRATAELETLQCPSALGSFAWTGDLAETVVHVARGGLTFVNYWTHLDTM